MADQKYEDDQTERKIRALSPQLHLRKPPSRTQATHNHHKFCHNPKLSIEI